MRLNKDNYQAILEKKQLSHEYVQKATLSLSQRRTISRVRQLAKSHPEECQIIAENKDGSICAHIPVSWVRINPSRELSEEQRRQMAERLSSR